MTGNFTDGSWTIFKNCYRLILLHDSTRNKGYSNFTLQSHIHQSMGNGCAETIFLRGPIFQSTFFPGLFPRYHFSDDHLSEDVFSRGPFFRGLFPGFLFLTFKVAIHKKLWRYFFKSSLPSIYSDVQGHRCQHNVRSCRGHIKICPDVCRQEKE